MSLLVPRLSQFAILLLSDENSSDLNLNYGTTFFGLFNGMRPYDEVKPGGYVYASNTLANRSDLDTVLLNAGVIIFNKYSTIAAFANNPKIRSSYDCVVLNSTSADRLSELYKTANFTLRLVEDKGIPSHLLPLISSYVSRTSIDFTNIPTINPPTKPISDFLSIESDVLQDSHIYQFDQDAIQAHLFANHRERVPTFKLLVSMYDVINGRSMLCGYCAELAIRIRLVIQDEDPSKDEEILLLWDKTIKGHRDAHDFKTVTVPKLSPRLIESDDPIELLPLPESSVQDSSAHPELLTAFEAIKHALPTDVKVALSRGTPNKSTWAGVSAILSGDRIGAISSSIALYFPGHAITRNDQKWNAFVEVFRPISTGLYNVEPLRSKPYPEEELGDLFHQLKAIFGKRAMTPETHAPSSPSSASNVEKTVPFWLIIQSRRGTKWLVQTNTGAQVTPAWDLNVSPSQLVHDTDSFPSYKDYLKQVFFGAPASFVLDACL
nr:MAG: hypothetical protein [brine shrimp reovirus 1]UNI74435.1 MAG: hypothetical protein [brine shrimp reovirus 1]